jgi:hypothetical protein
MVFDSPYDGLCVSNMLFHEILPIIFCILDCVHIFKSRPYALEAIHHHQWELAQLLLPVTIPQRQWIPTLSAAGGRIHCILTSPPLAHHFLSQVNPPLNWLRLCTNAISSPGVTRDEIELTHVTPSPGATAVTPSFPAVAA